MSPSIYRNSLASFSSTSVSTTSQEPEPWEFPDNSEHYPQAFAIGRLAYMREQFRAYLGPPIPERPNFVDAIEEMEAKGLPGVESDVLTEFVRGWVDARDEADAYYKK